MFAVALVALAFGAGCTLTYFVMEAPNRRAKEQLGRLRRERSEVADERDEVDRAAAAIAARERSVAVAEQRHARDARDLAAKAEAFGKRVITYDDLATENRIVNADLANVAAQIAHLEYQLGDAAGVAAGRDRLGAAYFDEVHAAAKKALTPSNYPAVKQRVRAAAVVVRTAGADLPLAAERRALDDLHAQYELAVRAAVEREEQARLREQMRDEQRRERQARDEVERAERERRAVEAALDRALAAAAGRHAEEVDRLRAQLAEAEAKSRRAISMAEITKSGNVYVISNRGSFGPDVLKIGMTRRLDPLDRVHELGDASVPFPFDVHMMVSCDDAPTLEAALHRAFHTRRVNKVNPRKEFFRVTVDEVAAAVRGCHGEVAYRADAEALEYVQSQAMTDEDLEEVEQAFAQAERAAGPDPGDDE
jgi:hypothetical protein